MDDDDLNTTPRSPPPTYTYNRYNVQSSEDKFETAVAAALLPSTLGALGGQRKSEIQKEKIKRTATTSTKKSKQKEHVGSVPLRLNLASTSGPTTRRRKAERKTMTAAATVLPVPAYLVFVGSQQDRVMDPGDNDDFEDESEGGAGSDLRLDVPSDRPPDYYSDHGDSQPEDDDGDNDDDSGGRNSDPVVRRLSMSLRWRRLRLHHYPLTYSPRRLPTRDQHRQEHQHRKQHTNVQLQPCPHPGRHAPHDRHQSSTSPTTRVSNHRRRLRYPEDVGKEGGGDREDEGGSASLDALLERSVHALETSNELLRSSISTQTSLSAVVRAADDHDHNGHSDRADPDNHPNDGDAPAPADRALDRALDRARLWSVRIRKRIDDPAWAGDDGLVGQISKRVDSLLFEHEEEAGEGVDRYTDTSWRPTARLGGLSTSLPTAPSHLHHRHQRHHRAEEQRPSQRARKRASLDSFRPVRGDGYGDGDAGQPQLCLLSSVCERTRLVAPAPRALTTYVGSMDDPHEISLPSTLGVRAHSSHWRTPASSIDLGCFSLQQQQWRQQQQQSPQQRHHQSLSSSPAYSILSSFKPTSRAASLLSLSPRKTRVREAPSKDMFRGRPRTRMFKRVESTPTSPTPCPPMILVRDDLTTPCIDEESSRSSSSSAGSVKQSILTLRKILDEQSATESPQRVSPSSSRGGVFFREEDKEQQWRRRHLKPPRRLIPPRPEPALGTSTATASISRLFTKAIHSSSTRARTPPRHSSMKRRSYPTVPPTPAPTPAETPSAVPSSGRSTPKRITFAALPESYAAGRRGSMRRRRAKGKGKTRGRGGGRRAVAPSVDEDEDDMDDDDGTDREKGGLLAWILSMVSPPDMHTSLRRGEMSFPTTPWESRLTMDEWVS